MSSKISICGFAVVLCALSACKGGQEGKSVQEINGNVTPADLIKNNVTADAPKDTINVAKIEFTEKAFNFGKVKEGEDVEHTFKFKNVGKMPLLIKSARSSCGCTIPEWPKDPIAVGASGQINVKFRSKGKGGQTINKPIYINANTFPVEDVYVHIEGEVSK